MRPALRGPRSCLAACALTALLVAAPACTPDTPAAQGACATGRCETLTFVASTLSFVLPRSADGLVVDGFDLDGIRSTGDIAVDGTGCGLRDKVSPDGTIGIDNNLAGLFAFIVKLTGDAVFGLIQTAINQGTILFVMRFEGVDDLRDDDDFVLTVMKGRDRVDLPPQLGTDGLLAPNQTFDVDTTVAAASAHGHIEGGRFEVGPFDEFVLPVRFFQVAWEFRVHGGMLRGTLTDDGRIELGMLGGGIEAQQVLDLAAYAGSMDRNAAQIAGVAPAIVSPLADLDYDGQETCRQLSTALSFTGTRAHLLGDPL